MPTFLVSFMLLRELLLVVLIIDMPPLPLLLTVTLVQAVIPAFVGSLLLAPAVVILATNSKERLRDVWKALADVRPHIYRSAACSAGLALFAAITLGPVGIIVQPMVLGPPLLIHEVVLHKRSLEAAWERTREMIATDARSLALLLAIPAGVGLVLSVTLRAFGILSGDVPGVARGVVYFALQGALIGAAVPFVAAVALLCYRDLASTPGADDAG
ncbi:MAG TPA: hypothetical protein VHN13_23395 [Candidatus Tectomicrobia bacterium]|nr:hypothetical protein [Candidatus Tectomicrobia bacterium]